MNGVAPGQQQRLLLVVPDGGVERVQLHVLALPARTKGLGVVLADARHVGVWTGLQLPRDTQGLTCVIERAFHHHPQLALKGLPFTAVGPRLRLQPGRQVLVDIHHHPALLATGQRPNGQRQQAQVQPATAEANGE